MRLIDTPELYNGGEEEVALLNNLVRKLHEHLRPNDISAWIVATGVQSEMRVSMESLAPRHKLTRIHALPVIESLVLKLRENSIGSQGQPWFQFSLVVQHKAPPTVSYNWTVNPRVHDFDLILDLAEFPRERSTLPDWYFS